MERPNISGEEIPKLTKDYFEINVHRIEELVAYDDRNFHLWVVDEDDITREYLLKISSSSKGKELSMLNTHNEIMVYLDHCGIRVQTPIKSVNDRLVETVTLRSIAGESDLPRQHNMRLLTFVPGKTCQQLAPLDVEVYGAMGVFIAHLQYVLQQLSSTWTQPIEEHCWTLSNAHTAIPHLKSVQNVDNRQLASSVLQTFEKVYAKRLSGSVPKWLNRVQDAEFPITLIHGDPNQMNILIHFIQTDDSKEAEFGILDWEDCAISRRIYDLAICLMELLCFEAESTSLELGVALIRGFAQESAKNAWPVTVNEMEALPTLVATRLVKSLVTGEHSYRTQLPQNEYTLLTASQGGWDKLANFWKKNHSQYQSAWTKCI